MPSYVLACAAQYSIDKNSNKQLDPSILQYLHSPIFDGGFLESFSKWKFLEDFGSRQSGISGTQKYHNAMSSFHEELAMILNLDRFGYQYFLRLLFIKESS